MVLQVLYPVLCLRFDVVISTNILRDTKVGYNAKIEGQQNVSKSFIYSIVGP